MNLSELRQKYPQYNDMSDSQLVESFHKKYYSDMDFDTFANQISYNPSNDAEVRAIAPQLPGAELKQGRLPDKESDLFGMAREGLSGYIIVSNPFIDRLSTALNRANPLNLIRSDEDNREARYQAQQEDAQRKERHKEWVEENPVKATSANIVGSMIPAPWTAVKAPTTVSTTAKMLGAAGDIARVAASGAAREVVNNDFENIGDSLTTGAQNAAIFAGGTKILGAGGRKLFSAKDLVKDVNRGNIENIIKTPVGQRLLSRIVSVNEDAATRVSEAAPKALSNINNSTIDKLAKVRGRNIDFKKANTILGDKYDDFFLSNAGKQQVLPSASAGATDISGLKTGLNKFQVDKLERAFEVGATKTNAPAGSISVIKQASRELGNEIEAFNRNGNFSDARQLKAVKKDLDSLLESSGLKNIDRKYSNVKRGEEFYELGAGYNPNSIESTGLSFGQGGQPGFNRKAFLEGLIDKSTLNAGNKNISKAVIDKQSGFSKALPEEKYDELMKIANANNRLYRKVSNIERKAEAKLDRPYPIDRPLSEKWESIGSLIGSFGDKVRNALTANKYDRAGKMLLDPNYEANILLRYANKPDANPFIANFIKSLNRQKYSPVFTRQGNEHAD